MNLDSRSFLITIFIHGAALILFLFAGLKVPLPLPAEKGILINFGDMDEAGGTEEPLYNIEKINKVKPRAAKEPAKKVITKESLMTQDFEDAPSIKEKNKPKKKEIIKKKEVPKKVIADSKNEKGAEEVKEPQPVVNKNALYQGRKRGTEYTGSEGVGTGKGNQGSLSGSENATDHSLYGGSGGVPSFDLGGRNYVSLPKPDTKTQKEGKIVVEIKVDRAGNVISAVPGVKGSTTLESSLLNAAKRAALASKFDSKSDAAFTQTGTITYIFKF